MSLNNIVYFRSRQGIWEIADVGLCISEITRLYVWDYTLLAG